MTEHKFRNLFFLALAVIAAILMVAFNQRSQVEYVEIYKTVPVYVDRPVTVNVLVDTHLTRWEICGDPCCAEPTVEETTVITNTNTITSTINTIDNTPIIVEPVEEPAEEPVDNGENGNMYRHCLDSNGRSTKCQSGAYKLHNGKTTPERVGIGNRDAKSQGRGQGH